MSNFGLKCKPNEEFERMYDEYSDNEKMNGNEMINKKEGIMELVSIETLMEIIDYLLDAIEDEHLGMRAKMIDEIKNEFDVEL